MRTSIWRFELVKLIISPATVSMDARIIVIVSILFSSFSILD